MAGLPPVFVEFIAGTGLFKAGVREVQKELTKVDKAGGGAMAKASALSKMALLGIAGAAGAAGVASVKMAGDFQQATTKLVTSAGESHAQIDMVRKGILDMAGQVGVSADELASAMYTVESGGRHGAEGLQVLRAAAEGAKAEGAELTTVADAVTSVLQDYHLKGSDAAKVTSQLVAAVGAGKTNFQEFSASLAAVLPIASSAHIQLSDITGALASMTVHGMSAEQASQNMADAIRHMLAPTHQQSVELGQLGMSSSQLADMLSSKGLTGTMQTLSQVILQHMGPSGRVLLNAFNQSKDAAADANAMISKMPASIQNLAKSFLAGKITLGDWRKTLKSLPADQANLLQQFASLANQAHGFNNQLKSGSPAAQTYQDVLRKVTGDATGLNVALMLTGENTDYVNNAVKQVAGATTEAGNHVKGWSDVQKNFNQHLAEAKGHAQALGITLGDKLLPVADKLLTTTMSLVDWFGKHKAVTSVLTGTVGTLLGVMATYKTVTTAAALATKAQAAAMGIWQGISKAAAASTKIMTAAQWALNIAMDANPVGLIVIGIVALIAVFVLLWTHSKAFRNFWKGLWKDIKEIAHAVGHWFSHDFVDFFKKAWKWISDKFDEASKWITKKATEIGDFFGKLPGKIIDFFKDLPGKFLNVGHNIVTGIINGVENAAGKLFGALGGIAKGALNAIKSALGIASPSRVFADEIGRWIPHGIAKGITDNTGVAVGAVARMAGRLSGTSIALPGASMTNVAAASAGGGGGMLQADIWIDGKKFASAIVPYVQRDKGRNVRSRYA